VTDASVTFKGKRTSSRSGNTPPAHKEALISMNGKKVRLACSEIEAAHSRLLRRTPNLLKPAEQRVSGMVEIVDGRQPTAIQN